MNGRSADKTLPWTWRMSARSELSWRLAWSAIFFLSRWISQRRSEMMLVYWAMWYDTFIKFFFTWRAWWEIENNKVFDTENVFVCFPLLLVPVGVAAVNHSQPMWFGTSFLLQQFVPLNISSANDCSTSWAMVAPETTYKLPLIHPSTQRRRRWGGLNCKLYDLLMTGSTSRTTINTMTTPGSAILATNVS